MKRANAIGQLGMLAVGLGIAAAMGAGSASADSTAIDPAAIDTAAFDPSALFAGPASSIPGLNLAISVDGYPVFQSGTATAYSGPGDMSIAYGDGSDAVSGGTGDQAIGDYAFADGTDSEAFAGLGDFDSASAIGTGSSANAGAGNGDIAFADGTDTGANAGGEPGVDTTLVAGNDSYAVAIGNNDFADAGTGVAGTTTATGDIASVFGNSSSALAGMGDFNLAEVLGSGSEASAGTGSYDFAGVLGEMLTATATGASNMFDFMPTL
jgi:hypothetical protein